MARRRWTTSLVYIQLPSEVLASLTRIIRAETPIPTSGDAWLMDAQFIGHKLWGPRDAAKYVAGYCCAGQQNPLALPITI